MLVRDSADTAWCRFQRPLVPGTFVERPNRFVAVISIEGTLVRAHVPDPGRLKELLLPGTPVYLEDFGPQLERKTRYALLLVASPDRSTWVSLNTTLPNRLVRLLLDEGLLPAFSDFAVVRPEVTHGSSRFDFLLAHRETGQQSLLEVKSVTLVLADGTAMFPDAPTVRGTRHLRELAHIAQRKGSPRTLVSGAEEGKLGAGVLFVVQRRDACCVVPNLHTDPNFCQAVLDAQTAGVAFQAVAMDLVPQGIRLDPVPIPFYPVAGGCSVPAR